MTDTRLPSLTAHPMKFSSIFWPFTWLFRSVQRVCRRRPPQNPNIYPMF